MPRVTGQDMTSDFRIAERVGGVEVRPHPRGACQWTCTPVAETAASLVLSESAAFTIPFDLFAAPA